LPDQFVEAERPATVSVVDAAGAELLPSLESLNARWRNGAAPADESTDNGVRPTRDTASLK
jgi:hypothetical protein